MKSARLLFTAWLAGLVEVAWADTEPFLSYDIRTIKGCSYWYDNYGKRTCESIRKAWEVSPEDFARWNPSLTVDCKGWSKHAYCVAVASENTSSSTTSTTTTTTTTSTSVSPVWTDIGCYKDASIHPFQTQLAVPNDLTRLECEGHCWDAGYKYVGFKAGTECWCGEYVQGDFSPSPTDCAMPCAGNASEICGGEGVFNVVAGNKPAWTPKKTPASTTAATSASVITVPTSSTSVSPPGASETAFLLMSHKNGDCTGDVTNEVLIRSDSDGMCIDTNCEVSSLDIASLGGCPDGEIQIGYWQNAGCSGEWYGYGYGSRNTCRQLWSGGDSFKSLWLRCAKPENDCVNKKTCTVSPEPSHGICRGGQPESDVSFSLKSHYHADCTGNQHNDVTIKQDTNGMCVNLDCQVASLDIGSAGNCPDGEFSFTTANKIAEEMPMPKRSSGRIVVLNGFPGTGKLTILKQAKTLLPADMTCLLDNHLLIDPVVAIVPGRSDEHHQLRRRVRAPIFGKLGERGKGRLHHPHDGMPS
ncbi:WSC domain protein [Cordyceps fumosorosea ARSEF 2679]|uniref:WSC domain protein n=1 Tax=Cordyceps fumosorosea (strain ARSEF 2679) TaxID=1081104 RepID=A0A167TMK8_CORFA|nr:WSC domain protein [Cordyceps fumosorosea ARSEF 2679]OAA60754.1 WSC domain protein [Cordyceps fumosorosea ARSEF 2679]